MEQEAEEPQQMQCSASDGEGTERSAEAGHEQESPGDGCHEESAQEEEEFETDPKRLVQRQKQIDYGKNTLGYERYLAAVPKDKRRRFGKNHDPPTPDITRKMSKKTWDGIDAAPGAGAGAGGSQHVDGSTSAATSMLQQPHQAQLVMRGTKVPHRKELQHVPGHELAIENAGALARQQGRRGQQRRGQQYVDDRRPCAQRPSHTAAHVPEGAGSMRAPQGGRATAACHGLHRHADTSGSRQDHSGAYTSSIKQQKCQDKVSPARAASRCVSGGCAVGGEGQEASRQKEESKRDTACHDRDAGLPGRHAKGLRDCSSFHDPHKECWQQQPRQHQAAGRQSDRGTPGGTIDGGSLEGGREQQGGGHQTAGEKAQSGSRLKLSRLPAATSNRWRHERPKAACRAPEYQEQQEDVFYPQRPPTSAGSRRGHESGQLTPAKRRAQEDQNVETKTRGPKLTGATPAFRN
eukprot:gene3537-3806_t